MVLWALAVISCFWTAAHGALGSGSDLQLLRITSAWLQSQTEHYPFLSPIVVEVVAQHLADSDAV